MGSFRVGNSPQHAKATVDTTVAKIVQGRTLRKSVMVQNVGTTTVYVGSQTVTIETGVRMKPGDSIGFDDFAGELYAIGSDISGDIRILEIF